MLTVFTVMTAGCSSTPSANEVTSHGGAIAGTGPTGGGAGDAGKKPWGKPRPDLGCTPQNADDESACAAKGAGYTFGPPPYCSGIDIPDREGDQSAVAPCECTSEAQRIECMARP